MANFQRGRLHPEQRRRDRDRGRLRPRRRDERKGECRFPNEANFKIHLVRMHFGLIVPPREKVQRYSVRAGGDGEGKAIEFKQCRKKFVRSRSWKNVRDPHFFAPRRLDFADYTIALVAA